MTHSQHYKFYIASCETDGGIYLCEFNGQSAIILDKTPSDRPMYLTKSNSMLYSVLRQPFRENTYSGIISYSTNTDGTLTNPSEVYSTYGKVGCHLCVFDNEVYCTNYSSGNVTKLPQTVIYHTGSSVNTLRQDMPHPHFIDSYEKHLLCCDLGTDEIYIYDKNLNLISKAKVPEGHGPRHLAFRNNYVYCVNELKSTLSVFLFENNRLTYIKTVSALPEVTATETTAAAIRIHKDFLYISNRGYNTISVFKLTENMPYLINCISSGGESPRDFYIIGDFLICANEKSDNVTFFELINGIPAKLDTELKIKMPICVMGV